MPDFYEFFAGGGMARAGLGAHWHCLFANDIDPKKAAVYRRNFGGEIFKTADVRTLNVRDLPGGAVDLVWGSFPCQDLSLAGDRAGLNAERSGAFWPFWRLMEGLVAEGRAPSIIALENVCGLLTSHEGEDFAAIAEAFKRISYAVGAVVVDAELFVPQSRQRVFIIGVNPNVHIPEELVGSPEPPFHSLALVNICQCLREPVWWRLPIPPKRNTVFADIIEDEPKGVPWHSAAETDRLIELMAPVHLEKVEAAKRTRKRMVGALFRRMRPDGAGAKIQRAEIRFDDVAGCLRVPSGGSSRQTILIVEGDRVRSRLLSRREASRLMGLSDDYVLPTNVNDALALAGDGVVVPVVRHLAQHLFEPILGAQP